MIDTCEIIYASELSLVPNLVIPLKFKVFKFEKYGGMKCPMTDLTMFYRKMVGCNWDDKLLIYYFEDNLKR